MIKLTEKKLHNIIKEAVDELEQLKNTQIKIYHRAGMHSDLPIQDVISSICEKGLTTETSKDNDGIGKCIWFAKDFSAYGNNGIFVVSMILTSQKIEKYHIDYDGSNAYAYRDIPFYELKIEKMPLFYTTVAGGNFITNLNKIPIKYQNFFDFFINSASNFKNYKFTMFIDAWDYFNKPYDLEKIKNFPNIEIKRLTTTL